MLQSPDIDYYNQTSVEDTKTNTKHQGLLDDNSTVEPPEPIPNSEVKRSCADGSVGSPHVRVGHRQALILKTLTGMPVRVFFRLQKSGFRLFCCLYVNKKIISRTQVLETSLLIYCLLLNCYIY